MNLAPIIPRRRTDPIDDPAWAAELKLDGFRGIADTIRGKLLSKNLNPLKRLRHILDTLPLNCVFDHHLGINCQHIGTRNKPLSPGMMTLIGSAGQTL